MPPDSSLDRTTRDHGTAHDPLVLAGDPAGLDLGDQALMGPRAAGDDQQAGGVLVQPVDDPGPRQCGEAGVEVQERIQHRPLAVPGPRMHDEAGRLVHDQDLGVFVDDLDGDGLGVLAAKDR